ncbi:hypothetical protein ONE63_000923 [Megalurothrips usitatus]|uniref:Gustatory receptor n=1 Tax=Megalurothrips usitatus TaxID=439358 RepID=A0AAV7Y006_9NEOP|nr:hypothetical protein ONE63_000923 [Megalurothrips usitatus]
MRESQTRPGGAPAAAAAAVVPAAACWRPTPPRGAPSRWPAACRGSRPPPTAAASPSACSGPSGGGRAAATTAATRAATTATAAGCGQWRASSAYCPCPSRSACARCTRRPRRRGGLAASRTPPCRCGTWAASTRLSVVQDCSCPVAVRSLPWIMYSFAVAAVLLPCSVMAPITDRENAQAGRPSRRMSSKPDEIVTFCDILSVSVCALICYLQAAFSQASLFALLDQLQQVDRLLTTRPPAVPGLLALWVSLLAAVMVMDGYMWTQTAKGLAYAATYFPFYGLYLNLFFMEALFIDEAHSIHMRFLALNDKLEATLALPSYQAATEQPQHPAMPLDGGWIGSSPRRRVLSISGLSDGTLYTSKANASNGNAPAASGLWRRRRPSPHPHAHMHPALSIQRLNMAHHLLCDATLSVGRRYGLSLLADMLCLLLHLVITAYFFLKYLLLAKADSQADTQPAYTLMQAAWLAVHLGRMFILVLPCSRASAEASRTGALVGVVLSTSAPSTIVHKQLETFSIQLLHHRVNFNACGLFELGLPLVVSILGAVTTYLVVLLQIKSSPDGAPANATAVT